MLLAWGEPHSLGMHVGESKLFQTGLEVLPPCSWCPLPWVGLQTLSHGFGGEACLTLLLVIQAAEEILEGGQEWRP